MFLIFWHGFPSNCWGSSGSPSSRCTISLILSALCHEKMGCQNRGLAYRVPHESHGIVLDEDFFLRSHVVPSEFDYFFHQSQPKVADERFVCSLTQSQPTLNTQGRMGLLLEVFAVLQSFLTNLKACLASCLAIYLIAFVYVSHMYVGHVKFRRVPFDHFSYLRIWNNFTRT